MPVSAATELRFVAVGQDDPLAEPLLAELTVEYATRYEVTESAVSTWLRGYPADEFSAPDGGLLIGLLATNPSPAARSAASTPRPPSSNASGPTAGHRRRGHARALLVELETEIAARGYRRVYLTTGDRQPEAEALYLSSGYTAACRAATRRRRRLSRRLRQGAAMSGHLHLAVALDGYGWHPEAWRHAPNAEPVTSGRYWAGLATTAERGLLDFVTFDDALTAAAPPPSRHRAPVARGPPRRGARRLQGRTGHPPHRPHSRSPPSPTPSRSTSPKPLPPLTSSRMAGPAGRSGSAAPRTRPSCSGVATSARCDLFDEASDAVEVARRLWDSWEDDAVIRDVATGRFVDRDKLHYIDFAGEYFSVKGPSITPRPPQGQPVVAALAHAPTIYEFASRSADLVFITPKDDDSLQTILGEVTTAGGAHLKVYADLYVSFSGVTDPRSDALVFDGTPAELVDLVVRWQQQGIDGVRLRPAVNATDLPAIVDEVVPLLQKAGPVPHRLPRRRDAARPARPADRRQSLHEGGSIMTVPLSILDLAPISEGADAATALRNTVDLAQHAEQWGYKRYWVAEHHFVAVASASPAVLIGQIAAATNRIRVGAAAVQLGQTTAIAVVETFGMLDAFHPGRIDLGVGRSGQRRREALKEIGSKPTPKPPTSVARGRRASSSRRRST